MLNVYITDLAAYNNGFLIGEWVSLPLDSDELNTKIKEILKKGSEACGFNEEHEEFFITDSEFENGYELFEVGEYENINELNEKCEELSEFSEEDLKKISYLIEYVNLDFKEALERYEEVVIYENMSLKEVVEDFIEQTIDLDSIPSIIANNIDYDSIARDFELTGEYEKIDSDVYYFVN